MSQYHTLYEDHIEVVAYFNIINFYLDNLRFFYCEDMNALNYHKKCKTIYYLRLLESNIQINCTCYTSLKHPQ